MSNDKSSSGSNSEDGNSIASAGKFSTWLEQIRITGSSEEGMNVPCGECNACCRSSYFIHIEPDEKNALASIPEELLFAAPGLGAGHRLMGYNESGCCPMLVEGQCSIYATRPRTCRHYDCRIFPATGIRESGDKILVAERADKWRFDITDEKDKELIASVRKAAKFLEENKNEFPPGIVPASATQRAVVAIAIADVFLLDGPEKKSHRKIIQAIVKIVARGADVV